MLEKKIKFIIIFTAVALFSAMVLFFLFLNKKNNFNETKTKTEKENNSKAIEKQKSSDETEIESKIKSLQVEENYQPPASEEIEKKLDQLKIPNAEPVIPKTQEVSDKLNSLK